MAKKKEFSSGTENLPGGIGGPGIGGPEFIADARNISTGGLG